MTEQRILIVDDDPDLVLANRVILESAGYQVDTAASGNECLAKMHAQRPALVFMDVMMAYPLDGYYTVQQISDDPDLCSVPIVMVSSITNSDYAGAFPTDQYLNVVEFISKPLEPEVLLAKIRQFAK